MKDVGIIQGSGVQAVPLVVGKDTVYVHTDITKVDTDQEGNPVDDLYEYHEVQYDKDEYIELQSQQMDEMQEAIDFLLMNGGEE
jgi:hypothetical protein